MLFQNEHDTNLSVSDLLNFVTFFFFNSQFLRRNRLSESTSSLSRVAFPSSWVSDECLPGKPRGRSNTMPPRCGQETSNRKGSTENMNMLIKENTPFEKITKGRESPLQSSVWSPNMAVNPTMDSDNKESKKVLPIIKQSSTRKNSPKEGKSSPHDESNGLETIRKALSRSVGFGIKTALSKVFRKPPLGSRVSKGAKSVSKAKTQIAAEGKKDKVVGDMTTKQQKTPIKSTVSYDGLDQLMSLKEKKQEQWHSAETLTKKSRRWVKTQQDLSNWVENNGNKVADDSSDCDSLFSADSLSSAYATALAEKLQLEDCEPSEAESEDSRMSKDSLVKDSIGSTDTRPELKLSQSICHTFHSSSNPQSTTERENTEESKGMPENLFWSLHGQKIARQAVKETSHFSQITSYIQHSSDACARETEAFLTLTDAWSSNDATDSPRTLGATETSLKLSILSETSSSQSQSSLDLSGATTGSESQISHHFDSTQGKDATVKERSHICSEKKTGLVCFLDDLASTSASTLECTLLQENNGLLSNFEALSISGEISIPQKTRSNNALCTTKPPPELAPLETNDVDMLVVSAPFKESAILSGCSSSGCLPGKSPDKDKNSNSTKQTELMPLSDESVFTKIAPQNNVKESNQEAQFKESCIAETPSKKSHLSSKTHLGTQHFNRTLQPKNALESSNEQTSICSSKELPYSATHSLKSGNEFRCEPQSVMEHLINRVKKEVGDKKDMVQHQDQCTEKCPESRETRNTKDETFKMNIKSDSANEVTGCLAQCDSQLVHESYNVHSRKRSQNSPDDLASNLKTPKRSCVKSLVPDDSSVNKVPFLVNDSSNISRDSTHKLLPTENERTASLSQTFQEDSKTASMDNRSSMYENSSNPVASYTSKDRTTSTVMKQQTLSTDVLNKSEMHAIPDDVLESDTLQNIGLAINDKISEVVNKHLNMPLQVDCCEELNEEPETNNRTFSSTNTDALKSTQNKSETTDEGAEGDVEMCSSHTFSCMTECSVDDGENVDNTDDCVRGNNIFKPPTEKEAVLNHQGVGFLSIGQSLMVKNFSAEIENIDNHNAYGPVPQDLKIKLPNASAVQNAVPADNHPESLSTSDSVGFINNVIKTCPEVILSSENITVAEEHSDDFFLMKTETIPINKVVHNPAPKEKSVRTENNGFDRSLSAPNKADIYSEENRNSGVSKDVCDVAVSNQCSDAVVDHTTSDMLKKAAKSLESSEVNVAAKFKQMVEINSVAHPDNESLIQFQMKSIHLLNSDGAENAQATNSRPHKKLTYKECAGEYPNLITQEQLYSGQNTSTLSETKDKIMDLENHTCSGKQHKETKISKPCQALVFCSSELQRDNPTQIIQRINISEKPSNWPQNDDQSLSKEVHMPGRKIQKQCVNVQKEKKAVHRPEQTDIREANKLELQFSASKEHQVRSESADKEIKKQHTAVNSSRLIFSRTNEERQRAKPRKCRKAFFTAPLSSSTDSTPDSSLDEAAKYKLHKCGFSTPGKPVAENGNRSDESSASMSLEISPGSKESNSKHNQFYGTGSDNPYADIKDVTNDVAESQIPVLSKDEEIIQLGRSSSTKHVSHENNHARAKSFENDSIQTKEPILHFGSSDINPFVHANTKDCLLEAAYKNQPFGSAVDISSELSSHKSSISGIARCCSMDNGLNVQNSPFNSHLSTYAVQNRLSSTLSSAEDSKEHISTEHTLREAIQTPTICSEKILTSSGSDFCNDTLDLGSSSGQVDEIVLVYSSEHESQESKQDSRKCDHGTQTVKFYEDLEKKTRHRRSSTQVPVSRQMNRTSNTWTSLQNMSEHLSELIVSTSDLLGNIQCMRTGESSPLKTCSKALKFCSEKYCKSDDSTQTCIDVGSQTEDVAPLKKQNKVPQGTPPVQNPKSHEVNVIVKVIGSEVCNVPKQRGVINPIKDQCDSRQTFEAIKSMPDLRPGGSPLSDQIGRKLDTVKILSLDTVAPNQPSFNPGILDHKAFNPFAVGVQRNCTSQMLAKAGQTHQQMKPKTNPNKRVLLIDRASSPILTVDVSDFGKGKIKSGTVHTRTEALSKTVRNSPENKPVSSNKSKSHHQRDHFYTYQTGSKSVSSMSLENISNHSGMNLDAPDAYTTEVSSSRYMQNGGKKRINEVQSKVASQAIWCSPPSHSHASFVKRRQLVDSSQNALQSLTPINRSHRSSMQEYKRKLYKDGSCWGDLSKGTLQYQDEDTVSLAPSDCNTDVLVNINPLSETGLLQDDCWIPENLPVHNKFTNWSGISQQSAARLTYQNNATVEKSSDINAHNPHSPESESFRFRYKPEHSESADPRTREIKRLREEREQVLASMQLDTSVSPLSVELTEAKLHYGLGKTDTLLKMLKSSPRPESIIATKQQLYDR